MTTQDSIHPFQRTLGDGPYRYVGFFYISLEAGKMGRDYIDKSQVHPNFVRGAGTCAHCGQAILNVCQIMIGNGEVYGVGLDCVEKVSMPLKELTAIQKAKLAHDKKLRVARKARKGDSARTELRSLIETQSSILTSKPHPSPYMASQGNTLLDYANWTVEKSNDGGIVYALANVKAGLKG